jgi:hypothetical protein
MRTLVLLVACVSFAMPAAAEVVDSTVNGFAVRNVAQIAAHPSRVYNAAVDLLGRWWNPAHTFSNNSANLTLDARPGGCLCERGNGGVVHLTVVRRGAAIRFSGGLDRCNRRVAGTMIRKLTEAAGGTQFGGPTPLAVTCPAGSRPSRPPLTPSWPINSTG